MASNARLRNAARGWRFLPGCMRSYVYAEAGTALSDVMTANGVAVCLPEQTQCRGTPLFASGDFAGADMLAAAKVRACRGWVRRREHRLRHLRHGADARIWNVPRNDAARMRCQSLPRARAVE